MFDWFKNKGKKDSNEEVANNVYKLPAPTLVPPMPEVKPPKVEPKIFYRFGVTDQQRVAFSMGNMEITMNKEGCQQMIEQLTFFMERLDEEEVQE